MESDGLRLHFTLFDVDFVAAKNDWDLFANTDKVTLERISRLPSILMTDTYGASWERSCT